MDNNIDLTKLAFEAFNNSTITYGDESKSRSLKVFSLESYFKMNDKTYVFGIDFTGDITLDGIMDIIKERIKIQINRRNYK